MIPTKASFHRKTKRNFIWAGDVNVRKVVIVAWKKVCLPTHEVGLGINSLRAMNEAAILKLSWETYSSNKQWAIFLRHRFLKNGKPLINYIKPLLWYGFKNNMQSVMANSCWRIGDGTSVNFRRDKWLDQPIVDSLHIPDHLHSSLHVVVVDFLQDNNWSIPHSLARI